VPDPSLLLGHAATVDRLRRLAEAGELTHAMLFTGPDGVGKTTAALELAVGVVGAAGWPGGPLSHPDLWVEDGSAENLSIERVKPGGKEGPTLQDFLALRPYAGGRRVALLARADRLTEQAANCLLKTIEEPPAGSHLVLTAAHPEKLPETVISRCEHIVLRPVASSDIGRWLETRHSVDPERAGVAAALAAGAPGRALRLATETGVLAAELDALDRFLATGGGGVVGALRTAAAVAPGAGAEGREQGLATLSAWSSFVRDAACFATGAPELALWTAYRPALERWAEELPAERIVVILGRIVAAGEAVAAYAQPRLAFETLLLDIFAGSDSPPAVEPPKRPAALAALSDAATGDRGPRRRGAPRGKPRAAGSRSPAAAR